MTHSDKHMLVKGHGWYHLCDLSGVIGHCMQPEVHASTPPSINIEPGGWVECILPWLLWCILTIKYCD